MPPDHLAEQGDSQLDLKLVKETWSTSLHQLIECHLITWQPEDEQEDGPGLELKQVEETRNLKQVKETWDTHELDPITRQQKVSPEHTPLQQVVADVLEDLEITEGTSKTQSFHQAVQAV